MFTLRESPKPKHNRKTPKRADRGRFSPKDREYIINRDKGLCIKCGSGYEEIHHIIYKSQGGLGTVDNGACVCNQCHQWAHSERQGREWFEQYRLNNLMEG